MAKENKKGKTKNFVLRIDNDTMEAIEKWASDEFRSVNGQILYILNQSLKKNGRLPQKK
ncbi:MAG: Arc family DNA-binding protein [Tannerella sp.]|jgi:hypothetical protein|nr:Arc family DNA-binding protein [Tannerella sp.]